MPQEMTRQKSPVVPAPQRRFGVYVEEEGSKTPADRVVADLVQEVTTQTGGITHPSDKQVAAIFATHYRTSDASPLTQACEVVKALEQWRCGPNGGRHTVVDLLKGKIWNVYEGSIRC